MNGPLNRSEVRRRIFEIILRVAPGAAPRLCEDATLLGDVGLESVQVVELVYLVERAFSIEVDEASLTPIRTVRQLIDAVCREETPPPPRGAGAT